MRIIDRSILGALFLVTSIAITAVYTASLFRFSRTANLDSISPLEDRSLQPSPIQLYPLPGYSLSNEVARHLVESSLATSVAKSITFEPVAVHALRLAAVARMDPAIEGADEVFSDIFDILTNDGDTSRRSDSTPLIVDTAFGATYRIHPVGLSTGLASEMIGGMTHVDKVLSVMAELGVPLGQEIISNTGSAYRFADVLEDSLMRFSETRELEWSVIAFCHYLGSQTTWRNARGEAWNLDRAVVELLHRGNRTGACYGTHRLYALMTALMRERRMAGYLSKETTTQLDQLFTQIAGTLKERQHLNGSWDDTWCDKPSVGDSEQMMENDKALRERRFVVTSHMLEWFAISPPGYRPHDDVVHRAIEYISDQLLSSPDFCFRNNLYPSTHAVRALLHLDAKRLKSNSRPFVPRIRP